MPGSPNDHADELTDLAEHTFDLLKCLGQRLVLAESCTAGMISAAMGRIAGVSQSFCGSAVVYREQTKIDWLHVHQHTIQMYTTESIELSREMARQILEQTSEATVSLAVTGHLGPMAPPDKDGRIYCAIARRVLPNADREEAGGSPWPSANPGNVTDWTSSMSRLAQTERGPRQIESAVICLRMLSDHLSSLTRSRPKPR